MGLSKDDLALIDKIKAYRVDSKKLEIIKFKNEALEEQNKNLKNALKDIQSDIIDQNKLLEEIKELKNEKNNIIKEYVQYKTHFDFIVTTPSDSKTVYGEIRKNLENAKKEVLVCSPWITYLVEEFSGFDKDLKLKIITSFRQEDIESGITDIDKLRALMEIGSEIRYNNNLHAKMMFIDRKVAIISSANLTKRGLSVNYEAGVIIKEPKKVKNAINFFNGVWDESKPLNRRLENQISNK